MSAKFSTIAISLALVCSLQAANPDAAAGPVVFGFQQIPEGPRAARLGGAVLLTEFGCVNCHAPVKASAVAGRHGPDLRHAKLFKSGYLEAWLLAPQQTKPDTTMPDLLAGFPLAEREQIAADLAAYLRTLPSVAPPAASTAQPDLEQGAALYHSVGCVACHSPVQPPPATSVPVGTAPPKPALASVPLGRLADKYHLDALTDFLRDPHAWRPAGRMPSFRLTADEAAGLAAWLLAKGPQAGAPLAKVNRTGNAVAGREHFQKLQCGACHDLPDVARKALGKPLTELRWDAPRSCVAAQPVAGLPHFALTAKQTDALRAAAATDARLSERESMQANVLALGCTACHVRDTLGGPELGRALYFEGTGEDLGDEGRFPPRLSHAGYKLQPVALPGIIAGGIHLRPYFKTRMPEFGKTLSAPLAAAFESCDLPKNLKAYDQRGRNEAGRKLLGTTGMSCIACHPVNGHKSLGISAVDLSKAISYLRPEWLVDFLKNPAEFNPGTRMPSFWTDAKTTKLAADVDAIRVYLLEADQARLPDGLVADHAYELIPSQRPIIFRSFIQGAGTHGIAVGFPQGVNVAFDAESSCWALAWKGRFLDAEGTWYDRANPPAVPLGTDVISLSDGPPLAHLESEQQPWPAGIGEAGGVRYLGFRLDAKGTPTFRYRFDGVEVTDRVEPSDDGRSVTREVKWSGGSGTTWMRVATGKSIEPKENGVWRVAGKWDLEMLRPKDGQVRVRTAKIGKNQIQEAILAVPASPAEKVVRYRIQW